VADSTCALTHLLNMAYLHGCSMLQCGLGRDNSGLALRKCLLDAVTS